MSYNWSPGAKHRAIDHTVVQSVLIHPSWDTSDHISYLQNDAFLIEPEEDTPELRAVVEFIIERVRHS